jgi:hypothetical protein
MSAQGSPQVFGPLSRIDRVTARGTRERDRKLRETERRRASRAEADAHEALVASLTLAHQAPFAPVDWARIEADGPVVPTVARDAISAVARQELANYRPSLWDALLGRERERRRNLTDKVIAASKADAELYALAKGQADAHNRILRLADEVRALKPDAIAGVLKANGAGAALKPICEGFRILCEGRQRVVGQLDLWEFDALPDERCTAADGYVALTDDQRCQLQLDNACAVALRAAKELLQVVSLDGVEIIVRVCRAGGLMETDMLPVLHLTLPRHAATKLPFGKLDAVQAVAALGGHIDWTSARGLAPITIVDPGLLKLTAPKIAA